MDAKEFKSETYQRVYQYLKRHIAHQNLDRFTYVEIVEGNPADCLTTIMQ